MEEGSIWDGRREVEDCFTNRIPLINHPVWTAGLLETGRNGISTWKWGLQTWIWQKNISCQMLQARGAKEGPCFLVVREPQTGGGGCLTWFPKEWGCSEQCLSAQIEARGQPPGPVFIPHDWDQCTHLGTGFSLRGQAVIVSRNLETPL